MPESTRQSEDGERALLFSAFYGRQRMHRTKESPGVPRNGKIQLALPETKLEELTKQRSEGERFLLGLRVQINGVDQVEPTRNPSSPGREIFVSVGKKDLPAGRDVTVVVTNRDGLSSAPFTVTP